MYPVGRQSEPSRPRTQGACYRGPWRSQHTTACPFTPPPRGTQALNKAPPDQPPTARFAAVAASLLLSSRRRTQRTTQHATMASSSSRKRARASFGSEDSIISIRLADGGGAALSADKLLLQVVSTCARGLPGDAAEWDLSGLLIEGQPVSRAVVVAWLHAATTWIYRQPFAGEAQQEPPLNCSAAGLAQLLAFADAVGSSDGMLEACLPPLDQLQFVLQAGEQQQVEVQLDAGRAYSWEGDDELHLMKVGRDHKKSSHQLVHTAASNAAKAQLPQPFGRQLEALLWLAHRLELDSLVEELHSCVRNNTAWPESLLFAASIAHPGVLSARVLEVAAGPGQHSQLAFINSLGTEAAGFVAGTIRRQVFEPIDLSEQQKQPITFKARLTEDFVGGSKGQTVDVKLDLFGKGKMRVGSAYHVAQLLLGERVSAEDVSAEDVNELAAAHQEEAAAAAE